MMAINRCTYFVDTEGLIRHQRTFNPSQMTEKSLIIVNPNAREWPRVRFDKTGKGSCTIMEWVAVATRAIGAVVTPCVNGSTVSISK